MRKNNYIIYQKRIIDFIFAIIAIILLSPIMVVTYFAVLLTLGRPVIFTQERPGLNEIPFLIYKFRTMKNEYDTNGVLLPDGMRLSSFGRFLRSTSVDELPELFNILLGQMSFVGPRPLAMQYLPYYNDIERKRHSVKPGLTGLAQVSGRNDLSWEERFALDNQYISNITFNNDLKIILKTISKVVNRTGISERGTNGFIDFDLHRNKEKENERC